MIEWDDSEWEKPYIDKYKIFVIAPERVIAIIPSGTQVCWAINSGIKEVAKKHTIKSITVIQEKEGSQTIEVILIIEPKLVGQ